MTFIAVIDILLDTQFLQSKNTTDTEQNLLLQTVLPVTTIERVSDRTVELRVHIVVCIEQVKLNTPNVHTPYKCVYHIVAVRYINNNLIAILIELTLNRKRVEILCIVLSNLLAVHRKTLCEVTKAIEETYSTEVYVRVRSLLNVVACQDTKTTRINLQSLIQTKLHTEVSNRSTLLVRLNVHISTELLIDIIHLLHQLFVLYDSFLTVIAKTLKELDWIMSNLFIEFLIKSFEHVACFVIPCPPHIVSKLIKTCQFLWQS